MFAVLLCPLNMVKHYSPHTFFTIDQAACLTLSVYPTHKDAGGYKMVLLAPDRFSWFILFEYEPGGN